MENKIDALIQEFAQFTDNHYRATLTGNWKEANKNAKKLHKTFLQIVKLGDKAREALLALTRNEPGYIAVMAAAYSLKYNPEKAMEALTKLAKIPGLTGLGAQQTIKNWEEGTWQLE